MRCAGAVVCRARPATATAARREMSCANILDEAMSGVWGQFRSETKTVCEGSNSAVSTSANTNQEKIILTQMIVIQVLIKAKIINYSMYLGQYTFKPSDEP